MNKETLKNELRYRKLKLNHIISHNKELNSTLKNNNSIILHIETEIRNIQNRIRETETDDYKDI